MLDPDYLKPALEAASLITQLVVLTIAGTFVGRALDTWLETGPWLLLVLSFLGFGLGVFRLIQGAQKLDREDE